VINAINFAVANKARLKIDIINLSLGHPIYEPAATDPLVQAVENAVAAGIVVVASAGNFGGDPSTHVTGYGGITSPGNAPDAITVGAIDTFQTAARNDDVVAWYSSRGPTWYDGFQKPDLVAPGSHLISDVPTSSMIAKTYPGGLIKTSGTTNLTKLSGTSMAAGVVSGVVALVLEASRTNYPGALLTPNAVKAILQYTSLPLANADVLTQGAGALNAAGAIALAAAIDPSQPVGSWWLATGVNTSTTIAGETLAWGQRVVWGDRVIWGNQIFNNDPAWALRVVWGDRVIWGNRVVWGNSTVWDGNQAVWGSRVVWGDSLIGQAYSSRVVWGDLSTNVTADRVVWGDLQGLSIVPTSMSWGNLERANGDLVPK
jgi:serine protease AprX